VFLFTFGSLVQSGESGSMEKQHSIAAGTKTSKNVKILFAAHAVVKNVKGTAYVPS
jgi:hypothetical protein